MPRNAVPRTWNRMFPHVSSVAAGPDSTVYASSLGQGVYRIDEAGNWSPMDENWPEDATVNRLLVSRDVLTACTSKGLYQYVGERWEPTDVAIPVYRFRESESGRMLAATQYGIWCRTADGWMSWAFPDSIVYDLLYLPQFIIAGCEGGIAVYDRLTGDWSEFPLRSSVTGIAVFRGRLIGVSDRGQLIVGNKRGGFDIYRLGGLFMMGLIPKGREVYVCTDRGLFRLGLIRDSITLLPVRLGFPVADADWIGDTIVVATLFRGIQSI